MRLRLPRPWIFVVGALCACAGTGQAPPTDESPPSGDTGDSSGRPVDTDTASPPDDAPAWWALDGVLTLQAQQAVAHDATFAVELRKRDLSVLCATERGVAGLAPVDPPLDALYGAWQVTLAEGEGCEIPVPQQFLLALGPYDPQLDPAAAANGLDGATLFGLYVQPEGQPLYVFGVAGTPEQFAGEAMAAPPLPDGTYILDGLHLLPL